MAVTKLYAMSGTQIVKTKAQLMEEFGMSERVIGLRLAGIRKEMQPGGRYAGMRYAVGGSGRHTLVNYLVFIDYEMSKGMLKDKNTRKLLAPYNPAQVAHEIGAYADKELAVAAVNC